MRGVLLSLVALGLASGCSCGGTELKGHADTGVDPGPEPAVEVIPEPDATSDPGIEAEPDPEPDPEPECWDRDGDTYLDEACGGDDCNDLDDSINPGAYDVCGDGIDQDCDGRDPTMGLLGDVLVLLDYVHAGGVLTIYLLWTGSEYHFIWHTHGGEGIFLDRIDAAGERVGDEVRIRDYEYNYDIAWSGSGYGTAWQRESDRRRELFFQRLDGSGIPVTEDVQVTFMSDLILDFSSNEPRIVPSGDDFILTWIAYPDLVSTVFYTRVDGSGTRLLECMRVTDSPGQIGGLGSVWTGSEAGIVWRDERTATHSVYSNTVSADGTLISEDILLGSCASPFCKDLIIWTGSEYGVFWDDGSVHEILLSRIDPSSLDVVSSTVRTTRDDFYFDLKAVWAGTGYALLWTESSRTVGRLHLQQLTAGGSPSSNRVNIPVSTWPQGIQLAWSGTEYGVCWSEHTEEGSEYRVRVYFTRVGMCE